LAWNGARGAAFAGNPRVFDEIKMSKPVDPRQSEEMAKKKPGNLQDANPPKKTSTDNPERNPRDQKGRGGSK
jgi:hypothetical protein